jgi:hypothetical protein
MDNYNYAEADVRMILMIEEMKREDEEWFILIVC